MNDSAKLGLLTPALLNPATAALVGIAVVAVGLYRLLPDDDKASVNVEQEGRPEPVALTVEQPLPAAELNVDAGLPVVGQAEAAPIPEADQKEMIRSAMSELGKRSAAARAKKKARRREQDRQNSDFV